MPQGERHEELLAEGWKYLGPMRQDRTAEDLSRALEEQGQLEEGNVITMHFTFHQYTRTHRGCLELLAVQEV